MNTLYLTVIPGMVGDWWNDPNFSHGFLVPVFSAYLIWERRESLELFPERDTSTVGVFFVIAAMAMIVVGKAGGEYFTMRSSLVVLILGLFRIVLGRGGFRKCLFPLAFLLFMVPIPYILYDAIAFPLKMIASWFGENSLNLIGVPVFRDGNIIHLPNIQLEVADACSGIRSLMSLMALAAAASYFLELGLFSGGVLLASAVPISVATNSFRIFLTGILSYRFGQKAAEGFFHEFSGWVIFIAGALLVGGLGLALRKISAGCRKTGTLA
ncbi:MAG: exosortase/archaeosortase family protein [bacterium]|nr:exosortase/archaeosortase family protein [bacterium]